MRKGIFVKETAMELLVPLYLVYCSLYAGATHNLKHQ